MRAVLDRRFTVVTSEILVEELADVLSRPEWIRLVGLSRCRELLTILREAATVVTPTRHVTICRDPDDNAILDCALAGRADCDLLVLHPFRGIRILRPRDFLQLLP